MKIPKYIEKLLKQQADLGARLNSKNHNIWDWLRKNGIDVDGSNICCENSILLITEPFIYADGIRRLIQEQQNER